ncbi:MAG: bifunctional phosphoribosylaminoimidazolecarboxamide formyltransferase/IMP cyclohydrolase [Gammaproteobacteria bacterium]|nr:bifunctional phosphoribosylaminoimidazolecarboxamide formyltransferase/IMP cyclohydrolase [Gammaproteobacteria bacterium]
MTSLAPQTVLLSVYDKTELVKFSRQLQALGCSLLASGGTAAALDEAGVSRDSIEEVTGFPPMMDGRVKTLHPLVHGGILSRREKDHDDVVNYGIKEIDIVVVNLYPFSKVVSREGCTHDEAIENIDIGGSALIRAGGKNHKYVLVVVDPNDYSEVIARLQEDALDYEFRYKMATKAFAHVASYDIAIAQYFSRAEKFPETSFLAMTKSYDLRYGENPHQEAALYSVDDSTSVGTVVSANLLQGKQLSYNNIADVDAALKCVHHFPEAACVIVKHGNPCGVAIATNAEQAYQNAFATDPTSAFGGILAFNVPLDGDALQVIIENQFVESIIAPRIDATARQVAKRRSSLRVLELEVPFSLTNGLQYQQVSGGYLLQDADTKKLDSGSTKCVTDRAPTKSELEDLVFAWDVVRYVKSNAIVFAKEKRTVGIGAGQMSRVMSAKIATLKAQEAGLQLDGAVLASDAAFPFRDGIDTAAAAGIRAVIQPGGLRRDQEVIDAANESGMAMLFTGVRHFRH